MHGAACLIAEPAVDLPRAPATAPHIVRASVVPAPVFVLGTFPATLKIPVELSDPTASFEWSSFIDYDPTNGEGFVERRTSVVDPESLRGRIRTLSIDLPAPVDDQCHVIEVVVALGLQTGSNINAHTPDSRGGDSVTWFYSPGGDLRGCPTLDAGLLDGAALEGSTP